MYNIIKSQNYQLRHDLLTTVGALIALVMVVSMSCGDSVTGGDKALAMGENMPMIWIFICLFFTSRIAAWDFQDKTMNYELLMGHSKSTVYWGRFVTALLWCTVFCAVVLAVPILVSSFQNGWGDSVDWANVVKRYLLSILPMLRVIAECFFLAMLVRNCYIAFALGYVLMGAGMMLLFVMTEHVGANAIHGLGWGTLSVLMEFSNGHMELINGVDAMVYDSALGVKEVILTCAVSIGVGASCLFGGYGIFKKRDME